MTGIELIVTLFLLGCAESDVYEFKDQGYDMTIQRYVCPLIGHDATFTVWRRACPNEHERPAVAIRDSRSGRGFVHNRFGGIDTAFVEVEAVGVSLPSCELPAP